MGSKAVASSSSFVTIAARSVRRHRRRGHSSATSSVSALGAKPLVTDRATYVWFPPISANLGFRGYVRFREAARGVRMTVLGAKQP
jgi:hypothetical protein